MILSDQDIMNAVVMGDIGIEPFEPANIQPASLDLTLHRQFMRMSRPRFGNLIEIDLKDPQTTGLMEPCPVGPNGRFTLYPHEFALGSTQEWVRIPNDLVGRLDGKSSLGRLGLFVHATAGYVDPGWDGQLTLEFYNATSMPIQLYPGMKVCQISFIQMMNSAARPYGSSDLGSKYQGQEGPRPSRYWENFT